MDEIPTDIPALTPIRDEISRLVGKHYAEAPYPCWTEIPRPSMAVRPSMVINAISPWAKVIEQPWEKFPEILVAGCGTGREAIELAQYYEAANVLAVDLSRPSLAYALGKYRESGLTNIRWAQADILELPQTGLTFDMIECGGVLHHMADPWAGFRALVSILRPGGYVRTLLYSKSARQWIYAIAQWARERGLTAETLDTFRAAVLADKDNPLFRPILTSPDFSSDAGLKDLVFHPHEKPVDIPEIAENLSANGLRFLGFFVKPGATAAFHKRSYGHESDLSAWDAFERFNPLAFGAMYDFWAEKIR